MARAVPEVSSLQVAVCGVWLSFKIGSTMMSVDACVEMNVMPDQQPQEEGEIAHVVNSTDDINYQARLERARCGAKTHETLSKRTFVADVEKTEADKPLLLMLAKEFNITDVHFKQVKYGLKKPVANEGDSNVQRGLLDKRESSLMNKNAISFSGAVKMHKSILVERAAKAEPYCHVYKDGMGDVDLIHLFNIIDDDVSGLFICIYVIVFRNL